MTKPAAATPRPEIELAHPSYQPSKAEREETLDFPEGTTPEDLAQALTQPTRVRYVDPKRQR